MDLHRSSSAPELLSSEPTPAASPPSEPCGRGCGRVRLYLLLLGIVCALIGGGYALWLNTVRDWFQPHDWGVVDPNGFYRSGQLSRFLMKRTLEQHHIGLIVSLSGDGPPGPDTAAEKQMTADMGVRRAAWNLAGNGTGNIHHYADAIKAIHDAREQGTVVLVHCQAGSERTSALVAYWRVLVEHASGRQTYAEMLRFHHRPHSNPKLLPYLNEHMREMARLLVADKVIPAVPDPLPVIGP